MKVLISMTGKAPKKGKDSGRPRKNQTKHEIWKELIRDIVEDEVARIFRKLIEEGDDKAGEKIKQIINKTKLSSHKLASILNISKSKICYLRNGIIKIGHLNRKNEWLRNVLQEIIKKYKNRVGRKPIVRIIFKEYGCIYSDRQIGRIMVENNWKCSIRVARKQKEFKDTTILIKDIVLRDYDNLKHDNWIYATDVTYIPATKDCNQNHVFYLPWLVIKPKKFLDENYQGRMIHFLS